MKGLKKLAALRLVLCLLASMLPVIASAESELPKDADSLFGIFNTQIAHSEDFTESEGNPALDNTAILEEKSVGFSTRAISNSNYTKLRNFINAYNRPDSDGYYRITETLGDNSIDCYFTIINVESGIKFQFISVQKKSTRIDIVLEFILTNTSNYITIDGIAVYYSNGIAQDALGSSTTIDQRTYAPSTKLRFYDSSYMISSTIFSELMTSSMDFLCSYWDSALYDYLGFGLAGLGFTSYGGSTPACTNHIYDHACDSTCNNCGATRSTSHTYSNSCDASCNVCGATRSVSHTYGGSCDSTCNICGITRYVSYSHSYTASCDTRCNNCGDIRTQTNNHAFNGSTVCSLCYATFSDVNTSSWMIGPVVYVYDNGLMAGKGSDIYGDVKFDPNSPITREEFVQVLYNAEGKPSVSIANRFPDVANNGWYKNAVLWANSKNIANGMGNGNFGVGKSITRQDLAMMLYKYAMLKGYSLAANSGEIYKYADGNKVSGYAKTAMDWAVTNGVLSGKGTAGRPVSTFKLDPTGTATRAECAAMLKNFMKAFEGSGGSDDQLVMTHDRYMEAEEGELITIEAYVQGTQEWWNDTICIYAQDFDGGYYIYNATCPEQMAARLVPGTKIRVTGFKAIWMGQHEILAGPIEILDDGDTYVAQPVDLTNYLGSDQLYNYQGMLASFKGLTIEAIEYKTGEPGDDIYITASLNGNSYEFCVEVYLTGTNSDVYTTVGTLKVGDKVDIEGFVYWYNGVSSHITAISKG